jgi:hypothetical protein
MQSHILNRIRRLATVIFLLVTILLPGDHAFAQQGYDPSPPDQTVKLIFIHHSTGENWLRDDYGGLGQALAENNYFVSDTNYGWGPDSIGDRTDIPNWEEWFSSDQTQVYMDALFNESGQNADYSRLAADSGGENQIILFKSCFPNSALEGNPDDPPSADGWLTVGHAKYVYNEILQYFSTQPGKLFVVITAPPLSDSTYAENARAFNQWLTGDWLDENDYTLANVAVFDFYNILTARDAHHRYQEGYIEHSYGSSNTLAYPSGDDHPSERGSRKATDEFVPLLNVFYHRWQLENPGDQPVEGSGDNQPPQEVNTESAPDEPAGVPLPPETVLSIDDFEAGSDNWAAFYDETTDTSLTCTVEQGAGGDGSVSLRIDFSIAPGGWANCTLFFDTPQDWSEGEWLAFDIHSLESGQPFNVIVYSGTGEVFETYVQRKETPVEYPEGFIPFTTLWKDFRRVAWEADANSEFEKSGQVRGIGFGLDAGSDNPRSGSLWIDNIRLEKSPTYEQNENPLKIGLPCSGSLLIFFGLLCLKLAFQRKN